MRTRHNSPLPVWVWPAEDNGHAMVDVTPRDDLRGPRRIWQCQACGDRATDVGAATLGAALERACSGREGD